MKTTKEKEIREKSELLEVSIGAEHERYQKQECKGPRIWGSNTLKEALEFLSFKAGRAFGDQVASSFDRKRNWSARRK